MWTRVAPAHALVVAVLVLAQFGGGTPGRSPVEQIERSVTRPVPQAPAAPVERSPNVWVPDRYLADPMQGGTSFVPGHWERRLSDGQYYAPRRSSAIPRAGRVRRPRPACVLRPTSVAHRSTRAWRHEVNQEPSSA